MYKCLDCGAEFPEPDIFRETVPYGCGEADMPKQSCCPFCHGDYAEEKQCASCGGYFLETQSKVKDMCEDCLDELKMRFSNMLHNNFTEYEREALNVIYDGRNLE